MSSLLSCNFQKIFLHRKGKLVSRCPELEIVDKQIICVVVNSRTILQLCLTFMSSKIRVQVTRDKFIAIVIRRGNVLFRLKLYLQKKGERKLFLQTRLPKGVFAIYLSVIDKPGRDLFLVCRQEWHVIKEPFLLSLLKSGCQKLLPMYMTKYILL